MENTISQTPEQRKEIIQNLFNEWELLLGNKKSALKSQLFGFQSWEFGVTFLDITMTIIAIGKFGLSGKYKPDNEWQYKLCFENKKYDLSFNTGIKFVNAHNIALEEHRKNINERSDYTDIDI